MSSSVVVPKIKSTKDSVRLLLEIKEQYRDSDEKLVASYWWLEIKKKLKKTDEEIKKMTLLEFLNLYTENKLTSADIITRARRKAQEENPELRGTKWKMRHNEEELVREEINDTDSYRVDRSGGGYTP